MDRRRTSAQPHSLALDFVEQTLADAEPPARPIDDEAFDQDTGFGIDVFGEGPVDPSDDGSVRVGDEKAVLLFAENASQPRRGVGRRDLVAELCHQAGDALHIGHPRRPHVEPHMGGGYGANRRKKLAAFHRGRA